MKATTSSERRRYYVAPAGGGYGAVVDPGPLMTLSEARVELARVATEDAKRARRYFGTAVLHKRGPNLITITARRDPDSALWCHWVVDEWAGG